VTTPQGTSAVNVPGDEFTYEDAPTVTGVAPDNGSTAGGTAITITGTGFIGATAVDIGPANACTSAFIVVSATSITCTTPPGAGTVGITVTTPQGTSATNAPGDQFSYLSVSPTAYVANFNDNTVTPIDTANNTPGTPIRVGVNPIAIVITPGAASAYVANEGDNTVTPIDTANNTPGTPIQVGNSPDAIAMTPDGPTAYVANSGVGTVTPIDTATNTPGLPIPVGDGPSAIAITPNGPTAYVANFLDGTVTPIDTATNTAGTPIPVGNYPSAIAITPDGSTAYVANSGDGDVTPIDTATDTAGTTIPVGNSPGAIAISYVPVRPTVTGVAPDNGSTAGGTALIITGTGFMGATAADIGGSDTCASEFTVVNATEITCTTPPGAGTMDYT
jgi:YVTN family beta-propeller protein